jgi:hypothetical protein
MGADSMPFKDGQLTRNLRAAQRLQKSHPIGIVSEADWLASLGPPFGTAPGLSTAQLSQLLKLPGEQIRTWVRRGLIQPTASVLGVHFF